jgi:rubrerythrin
MAAHDDDWWARVTHAFQAHVREERHHLEAYESLARGITDPGTAFLVELILEDERRHHALFERLAATARGDGGRTGMPPSPRPAREEAERLLEPTERFLDAEHDDQDKLRALAAELDGVEDRLWRLLVELMDLDTRKHVAILEYLHERLRAAARP